MSFITAIKKLFGFSPKGLNVGAGDRMLSCEDCRQNFVFDAGEQRFFKSKGFTDPKRCPHCRKKVKSQLRKKFKNRHQKNGHSFTRPHSLIDGETPYAD